MWNMGRDLDKKYLTYFCVNLKDCIVPIPDTDATKQKSSREGHKSPSSNALINIIWECCIMMLFVQSRAQFPSCRKSALPLQITRTRMIQTYPISRV